MLNTKENFMVKKAKDKKKQKPKKDMNPIVTGGKKKDKSKNKKAGKK
jgi:hypothetical protein